MFSCIVLFAHAGLTILHPPPLLASLTRATSLPAFQIVNETYPGVACVDRSHRAGARADHADVAALLVPSLYHHVLVARCEMCTWSHRTHPNGQQVSREASFVLTATPVVPSIIDFAQVHDDDTDEEKNRNNLACVRACH